MAFRDTLQNSTAPIFLRLALGFIMLWSGLGKLFTTQHFSPQDAAILGSMGVIDTGSSMPVNLRTFTRGDDAPAPLPVRELNSADFARGAELTSLYSVAVVIHKASNPEMGIRLWPPKIDTRPWPVVFAWAVAFLQTLGGAAILVGLFTRFFAFFISAIMLCALWLTQIGPAIQSGNAILGFLPPHGRFDEAAWMPMGWIVCLLAMAMTLTCAGSGGMSLDRLVGGSSKPAKLKPKDE